MACYVYWNLHFAFVYIKELAKYEDMEEKVILTEKGNYDIRQDSLL